MLNASFGTVLTIYVRLRQQLSTCRLNTNSLLARDYRNHNILTLLSSAV